MTDVTRKSRVVGLAGEARDFVRPLSPARDQRPSPPRLPAGRTVKVPGRGEMFLRELEGPPGPPIVLLHGWTLSADLNWFTGGFRVAARHGPVLAPDLRGHGRGLRSVERFTLEAAADDVSALISHLGLGRAVIAGYSLGGSLALLMWRRHPETVRAMVLMSTGLQWRSSLRERVLWMGMGGVEYVLRFGAPRGLTERYLRRATEISPELNPVRGWLQAEVRRGDASDVAAAAKGLSRFDARGFAGGVDVPTAVVVTTRDHLIRASRQRRLARSIPGARTVELDGGHDAWMVRATAFSAALDQALGLVLGGTAGGPADRPVSGSSPPQCGYTVQP